MADLLYELLASDFDSSTSQSPAQDAIASKYLSTLPTLELSSLTDSEPQSLNQAANSILLSLQGLSNRSHKNIVNTFDSLAILPKALPTFEKDAQALAELLPKLDNAALRFSSTYSKSGDKPVLSRRKTAILLNRNVDRISDILELPTLLATAVSSSTSSLGSSTIPGANYSSALDVHAHIRRLQILYPDSRLVQDVSKQAEKSMREMTTNLIASLRVQGIRLPPAMRTIGLLRRVAPELTSKSQTAVKQPEFEGDLGALFLVCRLHNLLSTLEALEPLRELSEQETRLRIQDEGGNGKPKKDNGWSGGQQTERYLKKYIEIFREQSFAVISLFKSIFPSASEDLVSNLNGMGSSPALKHQRFSSSLSQLDYRESLEFQRLPSALATFPLHLIELLKATLAACLPNIRDQSSRESLMTQVLYCAGSLGRLGGDFSMELALMGEEEYLDSSDATGQQDWIDVVRRHRLLAGRLEILASGLGSEGAGVSKTVPAF